MLAYQINMVSHLQKFAIKYLQEETNCELKVIVL